MWTESNTKIMFEACIASAMYVTIQALMPVVGQQLLLLAIALDGSTFLCCSSDVLSVSLRVRWRTRLALRLQLGRWRENHCGYEMGLKARVLCRRLSVALGQGLTLHIVCCLLKTWLYWSIAADVTRGAENFCESGPLQGCVA